MTKTQFITWLKSPTTVDGICAGISVGAGVVAHLVTHDMATDLVVGGAALSLTKIIAPSNVAEQSSIEQFVTDAVQAAATKHIAAAMPALVADAVKVFNAFEPAAGVVLPGAALVGAAAPGAPVQAPPVAA